MKNLLLVVVAISMLSSCSAPKLVAETANKDLSGACRAIFLNSELGKYQHVAQVVLGRAVLALADDPQYGQFCAWSNGGYNDIHDSLTILGLVAWEKLELVAIARCEAAKPEYVKAPCKIYARNNDITWHDKKKVGLD